MDERSYRKFVEGISSPPAGTAGEIFATRAPAHAAIVVKTLFAKATYLVEILTKSLSLNIYGTHDVYVEALDFLERSAAARGGKPGILILHEDDLQLPQEGAHEYSLIKEICDRGLSHDLAVRRIPPEIKATFSLHFMLADKQHYRVTRQRQKPDAINQFYEPSFGSELHETFQRLWQKSAESTAPAVHSTADGMNSVLFRRSA